MHAQAGTIGYQAIVDEQVRQVQKQASRNRNFEAHEEPSVESAWADVPQDKTLYAGQSTPSTAATPPVPRHQQAERLVLSELEGACPSPETVAYLVVNALEQTGLLVSPTPRVDLEEVIDHLRAASARLTELEGQVGRLIEAGDTLARNYRTVREDSPVLPYSVDTWDTVARAIAPAHKQTRPFAKASEVFGR